jgi:hypothetical protein
MEVSSLFDDPNVKKDDMFVVTCHMEVCITNVTCAEPIVGKFDGSSDMFF